MLLVDEDEIAALVESERTQWAAGQSPECAAALQSVPAADVLARLVERARGRL